MNKKLVFACALALVLGLTACGAKDAASSGAASSGAASSGVVSEIEPEAPETTPGEQPEAEPEQPEQPAEQPEQKPVEKPAEKPAAKPETKPVEQPAEKPAEKPAEQPAASVADVAADVEAAMGELPALMELDGETLSAMYGIDPSLLDGYVCKMPMMNVHATEYFVAKVKSGNMDAVKAALAQRQSDLDDQWKQYLPAQYELVQNAKTVVSGDYVLFIVAAEADAAATAFQNAVG